jgi:hypothetical protein
VGAVLRLLAALSAFVPPAAWSSLIVAKDFADLAAEADLIFVGTVARVESRWSDPQRQAIETIVTFSDLEPLGGPLGEEVTLRFAGGEVEGIREVIAGVPRFVPGERVVLFARQETSVSPIVGFSQGCFRVVEDALGPAVRGCDGHGVVLPAETAELRAGAPATPGAQRVGLEGFLDRIRRQLERQRGDGS